MTKSKFYSFDTIKEKGAVYNMIVGGRGIGKTYGAKKMVIAKCIDKGCEFIYLRRHKAEMTASKAAFMNDVGREFPDYSFRVHGNKLQYTLGEVAKDSVWTTIGHFVVLTSAQAFRSVALKNVEDVIFDEFIIADGYGRYIPNEVVVFNDFYSTVDRYDDRVTVWMLANAIKIENPYFLEYDITPEREFVKRHKGFICAHFPQMEQFTNEVYETRFGKFIQGTGYADYAVANEFRDNHTRGVCPKPPDANYMMSLDLKPGKVSVWLYSLDNVHHFHVSMRQPKQPIFFTYQKDKVADDVRLVPRSEPLMARLRSAYSAARMTFDSAQCRNIFVHIFDYS